MTRSSSGLLLALLCGACATTPGVVDDAAGLPASQALPPMVQQLLDALPGDAAVWQRYLADDAIYVAEDGTILGKSELLSGFGPFPPGVSGTLNVRNPKVAEFGDTAVVVFDAHETETVFGQHIEIDYVSSQVWRGEAGRWRLVLAQTNVRAQDPPPSPVSRARLNEFRGTYALGDWRYVVEVDGAGLAGGSAPDQRVPLIAVGDNVFVSQGDPLASLKIFLRGDNGRVDRMVQRRKSADLVWQKLGNDAD